MPAKTDAVSPVEPTVLEPAGLTTANILDILRQGGKIRLAEGDGAAQSMDILAGKLSGTTAEDVFAARGDDATKLSEVVNHVFRLDSVEYRNSDAKYDTDGSMGIFVVMHITYKGKPAVLVGGATNVVLKCMRATELAVLPRWLTVTQDTTKAGNTVYDLVDAPTQSDAQADF
jgi:hypothetical protein